ncbi:lasso peptide biosynthesis PqqD family chaperone [Streptomyces aidingensis]|uniref:Coenzyme PQQ synthesis protein D (PqqD) n=1 Tax=Streptomyces aidingensis TaxID=910347 RepID=A0A1I1NVN7_9ACTN|nr:lasso peptide biosynthesis PqqD family chaperone [Streptomyces aidingensis]SFC97800.1 Coenzyme PQQ synthesis protein D (PqqD) [Streptomyces aidingensis]
MTLRFASGVSTAETDYGTVLLNERTGDYWELNPTGAVVVSALLAGGDEQAAVTALTAEFDVTPEEARQDVTALIGDLRGSGLLA